MTLGSDLLATNMRPEWASRLNSLDFLSNGAPYTFPGNVTVQGTLTAQSASITGALTAYSANGWGYVAPGVNGVIGNGVTDDTAAIQAIFNAYTNIFIAPGTYLISSTLIKNLTGVGHCRIIGSGAYYSHFLAKSSIGAFTAAIQITVPNGVANDYQIGGFSVVNQTAGSGASYGFFLNGSGTAGGNTKSLAFDIVSSGFGVNFLQQSTRMLVWERCASWNLDNSNVATSGETGWYLYTASNGDFCGDCDFDACVTRSSATGAGVSLTDQGTTGSKISGIRFRNHTFYNANVGLNCVLSGANSGIADIWINPGCQFDGSTSNACILMNAGASGTSILDFHVSETYFSTANTGTHIKGQVSNGGALNSIFLKGNWHLGNAGGAVDIRGTGGTASLINVSNNISKGNDNTGTVFYLENVSNATVNGNTGANGAVTATNFIQVNDVNAGDWISVTGNNSGGIATTPVSISGGSVTHSVNANNI